MVSNGKISAPVSIEDLMQVLPVTLKRTVNGTVQTKTSSDLGVIIGADVGDSVPSMDGLGSWTVDSRVNINIWAKYKPVRLNTLFTNTADQWDSANNTWKSGATWWKGFGDTIGGIAPFRNATLSNVINAYGNHANDPLNGWVYYSPTGTTQSPYRDTDFAGYNHAAPRPVEDFNVPSEVNEEGIFVVGAMMSIPDANADYLTLEDFVDTGSTLYFGVYMVQYGVEQPRSIAVTAPNPGDAIIVIDFSDSGNRLPLGNYHVYPFLSTAEIPINSQSLPSATFYTCPYLNYKNTQLVAPSTLINITLSATFDYNRANITATVINEMETSYSNCWLYIIPCIAGSYNYYNDPDAAVQAGAYVWSSGSFTLATGTTTRLISNLTLTEGDYFIYLTINNAQYTKKDLVYYNFIPDRSQTT